MKEKELVLNEKALVESGTINVNTNEIKEKTEEIISKFKGLVITDELVKEAKKDMAYLNKLKASVKEIHTQVKKEFLKPLNIFTEEIKEIEKEINDTREDIKAQVLKFEQDKKAQIYETISNYISEYISMLDEDSSQYVNKYLINPEKYVKLTAVTKSGELTKATLELINSDIETNILEAKTKALEKENQRNKLKNEIIKEVYEERKIISEKPEAKEEPDNSIQIRQDLEYVEKGKEYIISFKVKASSDLSVEEFKERIINGIKKDIITKEILELKEKECLI